MNRLRSTIKSTTFKGYASTYLVEFLLLVSGLLVYRLSNNFFGNEGVAELSIFKRIFSFAQPILLLGISTGITRYVTHSKNSSQQFSFYFSSCTFFVAISLVLSILLIPFSEEWSHLLFGNNSFSSFILPLSISIPGIYFHLMTFGYLRGRHDFKNANILQFVNMGLIPILAFFIGDSLRSVLLITGSAWLGISAFSFFKIVRKPSNKKNLRFQKSSLITLLRYGIPRVPGDIAFGGLFALPIIIVSKFNYPELADKMAFSLTLLNIVSAAFSPLSLMLLPTISQKIKNKQYKEIIQETKRAIWATVLLSSFGLLIYQIFTAELLELYLGEGSEYWIKDSQLIMSGAVFYALFIALRSVINAYYEKAVNSVNLLITLVYFCILFILVGMLKLDYVWFYYIFLSSLFLLMCLTLRSIYKMNVALKKLI